MNNAQPLRKFEAQEVKEIKMTAPLHPMLVHFPIALLLVGSLVYLYALWRRSDDVVWERTALLMLVLGWLGGLAG